MTSTPITVSIETAIFACIITFLVGFFGNLLAMRKMFMAKGEFEEYKKDHDRETREANQAADNLCKTRRDSCQPMVTSLSHMQEQIAELFRLIREGHGKIERLIGLMESRSLNNGEKK